MLHLASVGLKYVEDHKLLMTKTRRSVSQIQGVMIALTVRYLISQILDISVKREAMVKEIANKWTHFP